MYLLGLDGLDLGRGGHGGGCFRHDRFVLFVMCAVRHVILYWVVVWYASCLPILQAESGSPERRRREQHLRRRHPSMQQQQQHSHSLILVVLGEGAANASLPMLGDRTPLEVAHVPTMDAVAGRSACMHIGLSDVLSPSRLPPPRFTIQSRRAQRPAGPQAAGAGLRERRRGPGSDSRAACSGRAERGGVQAAPRDAIGRGRRWGSMMVFHHSIPPFPTPCSPRSIPRLQSAACACRSALLFLCRSRT